MPTKRYFPNSESETLSDQKKEKIGEGEQPQQQLWLLQVSLLHSFIVQFTVSEYNTILQLSQLS